MRIVAGIHKGKTLLAPKGHNTRPTSDRVRQAIFNILAHATWQTDSIIEQAHVLDVFAGTGALGLETLSRGAAEAIFVESADEARSACLGNIRKLDEETRATCLKADATRLPERATQVPPRTLVFLDPPYDKNLAATALARLAEKNWLDDRAICVVEMRRQSPETPPPGFDILDSRTWGDTRVDFWRWTKTA